MAIALRSSLRTLLGGIGKGCDFGHAREFEARKSLAREILEPGKLVKSPRGCFEQFIGSINQANPMVPL